MRRIFVFSSILVLMTLVACESKTPAEPTTPTKTTIKAAPSNKEAAKPATTAPAAKTEAKPDTAADKGKEEQAAKEEKKEPGLLPDPNFTLKGGDLKAPSLGGSRPSGDSKKPRLLDNELKPTK